MSKLTLLALLAVASLAAASNNNNEGVNRPVNKVITLLKEMQSQLEAEQKEDEEIYDKMDCWCETNDKAKTKAIEEAEARITELTSTIEELTAQSSRLNTEIKNLAKEIEKNEEALAQAQSIREKEHAAFSDEEKDMMQSIASLKAAIVVLSKHHSAPTEALLHISAMLRHQIHKHKDLLADVLTPQRKRVLGAFVQGDFFGQAPAFKQGYAPQSGEIFGILRDMQDQFEANLSQAQKEEMEAQKAFEELKAAKEAEIAAGKESMENKQNELAKTDEDNAQAKQDLEDTRNSLSADQRFLMDLKEKCRQTDEEWAQRQKTRQEEMQAVSQAIAILSSDDSHDLFTRTFNFQQEQIFKSDNIRELASNILKKAGRKANDAALLQLANEVQLDAFTRVKKAIDDMVVQLQQQQADEQKHRDWCIGERNGNDREVETRERDKADLEALIDSLSQRIGQLEKEIATLEAEIKDAQIQIKRAGEDREAENKEFQATVTDQRETQKVLQRAIDVLAAFYAKQAALLQSAAKDGPAPPPGFSDYQKNRGSGGVMAMLEKIKGEAKSMEAETVQAEQDSQAAYETFVKDTNNMIGQKQRQIVDDTEDKAKAETDRTNAEADKSATMTELEELANYSAQLHASCDFVVNNFDIRQTARAQEIEALKQAKAILSGAAFGGASLLRRN